MASISTDQKTGHRRILYFNTNGERKTLRIGKCSKADANDIKRHVENLVSAKLARSAPNSLTAVWLAEIGDVLHAKLAEHELCQPRKPMEPKTVVRLGSFLNSYISGRNDWSPASKVVRRQVARDLTDYFDAERDVTTITPGECGDFKQWLIGRKLRATTIAKRLQSARMFFEKMVDHRYIDSNPFAKVKHKASGNEERQHYVSPDDVVKCIEVAPDIHWRTIIALVRFAGLRNPSETLSLRWQDINWATEHIVVTSPKTACHEGQGTRTIPLFGELRRYLDAAYEAASEGTVYVVDERFRKAALRPGGWQNSNLRTTFEKIVRRAGLEPWPRLFHNLRASFETDLTARFPVHVCADWLGHSALIAKKHYLMTTDEHHKAAVEWVQKAAQNPAQFIAETTGNDQQQEMIAHEKTPVFPGFSGYCNILHTTKVEDRGLEPLTFWLPARRSPN